MASTGQPSHERSGRLAALRAKIVYIWQKEIWKSAHLKANSPRGWGYAALRVLSITCTVFSESKVPARAAALSFSSLLGMGPLIALAVLIGGFTLGSDRNPKFIAEKIGMLIETAAPQLRQLQDLEIVTPTTEQMVSPNLVLMIESMISSARSGSAGVVGVFSLIMIVLLLFKSVEDAFNDIWGVRMGRSLLMRIVFYWTILTGGAVLFFASLALLGAGVAVTVFDSAIAGSIRQMPGGEELLGVLRWSLPLFSNVFLVALLTLVYRIVPNTRVFWQAAFIGALVVTALLLLNNFVALFYVRRVLLTKSLYGALALPIVLMLGLYVFWLYLLIGGVISYAVQNVHFRNSQAAWSQLTERMRERLTLVVLLTICRRFHACLPPVTASQLSELIKVPTQILNECLNRLVEIQLIMPLRPESNATANEHRYQPARPLSRITLYEFKTLDDNVGEDPLGTTFERIDPLLAAYDGGLASLGDQKLFQKTLEQLFDENPFDESRPPFALGARHGKAEA